MPETIFDGRLRGSGQTVDVSARDTRPSSFDAVHELETTFRNNGRVILAPALHVALDAPFRLSVGRRRTSSGAIASSPATASVSTTAVAADGVTDGASDGASDTSVDQSVGASADGPDNSPHASVRNRGRDCSTQTPWRLRPAGFAGVDSPIAFHEILVLLYALRRSNLTPERTDGAELAKTATAYDGLRSGALFNDMGRQAHRGSSVCS